MILRRITKHVKEQNWFAVFLDFVIVVIGILIAFQITNFSDARREISELRQAEAALKNDLRRSYFNAKERMTLTDCRTEQLRGLSERLLEPGDTWAGTPMETTASWGERAIPPVLRSPSRLWGSRIWNAELSRGTFNRMDADQRAELDAVFEQSRSAELLQDQILTLQARLKVLSRATVLSRQDRLRYFDIVSEIDEQSVILEMIASQIAERIEGMDVTPDAETELRIRDSIESSRAARQAAYGPCVKPMELFFLDPVIDEIAE